MTPNMCANNTCVAIASENLNDVITDSKNELENRSNWMRISKLSLMKLSKGRRRSNIEGLASTKALTGKSNIKLSRTN